MSRDQMSNNNGQNDAQTHENRRSGRTFNSVRRSDTAQALAGSPVRGLSLESVGSIPRDRDNETTHVGQVFENEHQSEEPSEVYGWTMGGLIMANQQRHEDQVTLPSPVEQQFQQPTSAGHQTPHYFPHEQHHQQPISQIPTYGSNEQVAFQDHPQSRGNLSHNPGSMLSNLQTRAGNGLQPVNNSASRGGSVRRARPRNIIHQATRNTHRTDADRNGEMRNGQPNGVHRRS